MSKHKKIIEDSHYVALNKTLVDSMKANPQFKINDVSSYAVRPTAARVIYHTVMKNTVLATGIKLRLEHQAIVDLVNYHTELICGDVNHQHPKNVHSELLKASSNTTNELHRVGFNLCMLTIPIDGEFPKKLVEAIDSQSLYLLTDLEANFIRAYMAHGTMTAQW